MVPNESGWAPAVMRRGPGSFAHAPRPLGTIGDERCCASRPLKLGGSYMKERIKLIATLMATGAPDMTRLLALTALALSMGIAPVSAADTSTQPPTAST